MIKTSITLLLILIAGGMVPAFSSDVHIPAVEQRSAQEEISLLLSRLNLEQEGLESVRNSLHDPQQAATNLLTYYRLRTSVKHPIDRASKAVNEPYESLKETFDAPVEPTPPATDTAPADRFEQRFLRVEVTVP